VSEWDPGTRRADVVILTAIRLELDAVRRIDAGAVTGSVWEETQGPSGLPVAFRSFEVDRGRPLRVAVAVAPDMGAVAAVNTLLPLVEQLAPSCVAMCGVCAGRPGKTNLGDVVAADRLYYHDAGKQLSHHVQQDLTTYKLRDDWKAALESMDAVAHFRDEPWFQARPLTTEWRLYRALVALRDGVAEPWNAVDPAPGGADEWPLIVAALRKRKLLAATGRTLTKAGRRFVEDLLFRHRNALPDLSPSGALHPFRLHVAPIGSGTRVIEDEAIWTFVSQAMRKTLGLEMEAAALGELAHRQRQHKLHAVVMKGVMDFADHGRDDHFKEFAARASAECLLWFLRQHVPTELTAGFDDLLMPGTARLPGGNRAPSVLLHARYAVVPWRDAGRAEILADLDAWADDPSQDVAVRLLHAEGGAGKTRLAIEWIRRRRDVAGFLIPDPDDRWLERLCGLGPPVIVVLDYAESRADLVPLLARVAAFAAAPGPRRRVRVLLLARNDGDWWKTLPRRSSAIGALLGACAVTKLPPLAATSLEREAVLVEAARAFAGTQRRSMMPRPPSDLDDARFERVLYLHMAALATVEGVAFDAGSLMDVILDHEERFWVSEQVALHMAAVEVPLARQLIAAATLRGGLVTKEQAREVCARLANRDRTELIALFHHVYQRADDARHLPGLEPDLLGEAMVLRVAAPPEGAGDPAGDTWIERVFAAGDDPRAVTVGFAVMGRASATNPTAARPWIANLLCRELPARAVLALQAAKTVGQRTASATLGDLLAEALERDGSVAIALELAKEEIPYPTVSLRRLAEWQSRILHEYVVGEDDPDALATRAALLLQRGVRLSDMGQREPALAATREAVDLYRALATQNPDAFQPILAGNLNNLGNRLSDLGKREPALTATREAVDRYRTLVMRNPDAFQSDLAMSLNNLGTRLSELGHREPALVASREAVDLYRTLTTQDPDAFQPALAGSLNNLGVRLGEWGQREPALATTREAVNLYRMLATRNPDAFQPDLARSLNNLGIRLSALAQHEPALAATREAVGLYRTLATHNPDAFHPELASSLNNLGVNLSTLGQHEPALAVLREAVDLNRMLATRSPDAFQPDLARSLNNLGNRLSELGQHEPALVATREAVDLRRTLATRNPDAFEPDLARSLNNLGNRLRELGHHEPALAATRESTDLYRTLATRNPDAFQPDLAGSFNNLSVDLSELGQHQAALAATREAVDLYRTLATRNPDAFQPELARSLDNLGIDLSALGQSEAALAATREAEDIRRSLALQLEPGREKG
jgi:nucleoside phosphorylase